MMSRAINLRAEALAVPGLEDRTPDTPIADLDARCFGPTHPYRDGYISIVKYSGTSAWERHQDEEILIIAAGSGMLWIIGPDGHDTPRTLNEGLLVIVPALAWHQIEAPDGITMFTISPQPTEHRAAHP